MSTTAPLGALLRSCGPTLDPAGAMRLRERLSGEARDNGWSATLDQAWPALAPVLVASPYLAGLCLRWPDILCRVLSAPAQNRLEQLVLAVGRADGPEAASELRLAKAEAHLLTALADLGDVWPLDAVTGALSSFADAAVAAAVRLVMGTERARGRLASTGDDANGSMPGFFLLAMGKHGAGELNYSSDIDLSAFYDPAALRLGPGVEPHMFVPRFVRAVAALLQERTSDGYVFRVDLRLRPDPSSTPAAVPVDAALDYYESVGQNWERAAFIKARVCAGDRAAGEAFLRQLQPFVWRRSLDYAAIEDVKSVKQQIHAIRGGESTAAPGADLKLGRGGIREIEFFVQTQQLILGGRNPDLRSPRTRDALRALAAAGHVAEETAAELDGAYVRLRMLEHRVQMLADEQTHRLPLEDEARRRVAALAGDEDLAVFDRSASELLRRVNRRYGELFQEAEALSSSLGSLVFTGVEDDPETVETLRRLGFIEPEAVSSAIRGWHHGRVRATRTERGRELFTRLAPRLLEACGATGAADAAFRRFARFFEGLSSGVQAQALLLAQPGLLAELVEVLAYAPRLATMLARHPSTLDTILDADFARALDARAQPREDLHAATGSADFGTAMDAVRRVHREQAFRIGYHVLTGRADAEAAGRAFADLADGCIAVLANASLREMERLAGALDGRVAVLALGKSGSREMTAASDLDLMVVYDAPPGAEAALKSWPASQFYARFCQRLVTALSTPTAEGGLYEVDLRLRPSGGKGPVAASLSNLKAYYGREAETWEFLALTRARVVWALPGNFALDVGTAVDEALAQGPARHGWKAEVRAMRKLMARERTAEGFWDMKLNPGGLVDVEFAAQTLRLAGWGAGASTLPVLEAAAAGGAVHPDDADALARAWRMQQNLAQVFAAASEGHADPEAEPTEFRDLLARAGGEPSWSTLRARLIIEREAAHAAFERIVGDGSELSVR